MLSTSCYTFCVSVCKAIRFLHCILCYIGNEWDKEICPDAATCSKNCEMNFYTVAPFGEDDIAKELRDHAAKPQNTVVDAVENAAVPDIK